MLICSVSMVLSAVTNWDTFTTDGLLNPEMRGDKGTFPGMSARAIFDVIVAMIIVLMPL